MSDLFSGVLNMSMTGSVVILLVMLVRFLLKRAPKIFSYALWSVVLFRLLCPVAFTAPVSILKPLEPEVQEASGSTSVVSFLPAEVSREADFTFVPAENQSGTDSMQTGESGHTHLDLMTVAAYVWIAGTGIMTAYSVIQYIRLRGKLVGAVVYRGNVYRADYIDTPFVMGIFSPKIYLPSDVPMQERKYIIAHERHHIRRFDHIIKLLAYLALCIHWFNPLVWAAFLLAGKDMEMSCDEAVIRKMGPQIRADYSASLLRLATHKKIIAGMPLAFGEGDTKGRVMNMAKWKKPKVWVSLICLLLCATILVACAVNPKTAETKDGSVTGINIREEPSPTGAIVGYYDDGTVITILETKDGWGRTDLGWVSLNYVTTMDGTSMVDIGQMEPSEDGSVPTEIENEFKELNIREKPDKSSAVVGSYPNGTTVTILETKDGWGRTDQGWIHMDYVITVDGKTVVDTSDFQPAIDGSDIVTDTELVQYGDLRFLLTGDLKAEEGEAGSLVLTMDSETVGGVALRHPEQPNSPDAFSEDWQAAMGVPEAYNPAMGYIGGGSIYADYETTYFPDMQVNRDGFGNIIRDEIGAYVLDNEVTHYFFAKDSDVYDVWFYVNRLPNTNRENLLKSCSLEGITDPAEKTAQQTEEKAALAKCRAVVEGVQSGCYQIMVRQTNGREENAVSYEQTYSRSGENWLNITNVLPMGADFGDDVAYITTKSTLRAEGQQFTQGGGEWVKIADGTGPRMPWLAEFTWDENLISYQGTLENEGHTSIMLRVDQQYIDSQNFDPHYFVDFTFDAQGQFLDAGLQVNLFRDNQITATESIVTLDKSMVNGQIWREYEAATGTTRRPELPETPNYAVLEFMGSGVVTVTNAESVKNLLNLFENGEYLGWEPKTHSIGVGLNLVFTTGDQDFVIELDPDSDLCRIDGEYVFYGKEEQKEYTYKLWEYLGLTRWPDIVYQVCENALKP